MMIPAAAMPAGRSQSSEDDSQAHSAQSTSGGDEPVAWKPVATAAGALNATIIAGRLESYGIPTRITQEAAGIHVFPVVVGRLGEAKVWVPEECAEAAAAILSVEWDEEE